MSEIRIGLSGWQYPRWRGKFYPKGLAHRRELEYASAQFASLEINGSFYSMQKPSTYQKWYEQSPAGFLFSAKGPRFITHMKKLNDVEVPLANFFATGILKLEEKLGPILWQFPPNLGFDRQRFEKFFKLLPRDTRAAARLTKKHDHRVKHLDFLGSKTRRPLRYAIEVRHPSFECPEWIELLRKHNLASVVSDAGGRGDRPPFVPHFEDLSSDFVYLRLHGSRERYASEYTSTEINSWAEKILAWSKGKKAQAGPKVHPQNDFRKARDVFVYFDNDAKVHAPFDALKLELAIDAKERHRRGRSKTRRLTPQRVIFSEGDVVRQ